jgi:hypothetical protein
MYMRNAAHDRGIDVLQAGVTGVEHHALLAERVPQPPLAVGEPGPIPEVAG